MIDCEATSESRHRAFSFYGGSIGKDVSVEGLTITRGNHGEGGAVYCQSWSNIRILKCVITDNTAYSGGGIYISHHCNTIVDSCRIEDNQVIHKYGEGAGVRYGPGEGRHMISNCIIANNHTINGGGRNTFIDS